MIDKIFELIDRLDSFKKIILFLLTGISALCIFFGYNFVNNYQWNNKPTILRTVLPCSVIQLRADYYLVSISFPVNNTLREHRVKMFTSSLWLDFEPDQDQLNNICQDLILAVNSNEAEDDLKPYLERSR